jgi:hypothetical protein
VTIYRQLIQRCVDGIGDDSTSQIGLGGRLLGCKHILFLELLQDSTSGLSLNRMWKRGAMQQSQRLRLTRSAMAIALREERHVAIMIPEGATIEVIGGPFNGTRLMDVRYDGEMVLMFTDDMKTHTELIKAETA